MLMHIIPGRAFANPDHGIFRVGRFALPPNEASQFPVCSRPKRSRVLPLKRMNGIRLLEPGGGLLRAQTKNAALAPRFRFKNYKSDHACGCGSSPGSASGRGRGLPAGGTAEVRGVVGSSTDSRFGFLPLSRS